MEQKQVRIGKIHFKIEGLGIDMPFESVLYREWGDRYRLNMKIDYQYYSKYMKKLRSYCYTKRSEDKWKGSSSFYGGWSLGNLIYKLYSSDWTSHHCSLRKNFCMNFYGDSKFILDLIRDRRVNDYYVSPVDNKKSRYKIKVEIDKSKRSYIKNWIIMECL